MSDGKKVQFVKYSPLQHDEMSCEMTEYWNRKLLEEVMREPLPMFKPSRKLTWKEKLHIRYLRAINRLYELLTGDPPYDE